MRFGAAMQPYMHVLVDVQQHITASCEVSSKVADSNQAILFYPAELPIRY